MAGAGGHPSPGSLSPSRPPVQPPASHGCPAPRHSLVAHQLLHKGRLRLAHEAVQRDERLERGLRGRRFGRAHDTGPPAARDAGCHRPAAPVCAPGQSVKATACSRARTALPAPAHACLHPGPSTHQPVGGLQQAAVQLRDDVGHIAPRPAGVHCQLQGCMVSGKVRRGCWPHCCWPWLRARQQSSACQPPCCAAAAAYTAARWRCCHASAAPSRPPRRALTLHMLLLGHHVELAGGRLYDGHIQLLPRAGLEAAGCAHQASMFHSGQPVAWAGCPDPSPAQPSPCPSPCGPTFWSPPSLALVTLSFSENVVARLPATLVLCASAMVAMCYSARPGAKGRAVKGRAVGAAAAAVGVGEAPRVGRSARCKPH